MDAQSSNRVGEGARAGGKLAWPTWRAQLAHQMARRESVCDRLNQPLKLAASEEPPVLSDLYLGQVQDERANRAGMGTWAHGRHAPASDGYAAAPSHELGR